MLTLKYSRRTKTSPALGRDHGIVAESSLDADNVQAGEQIPGLRLRRAITLYEHYTVKSVRIRCSYIAGYTWSFEPKTDWSANYASATEIFQYFKDFTAKYGLEKYIKLRHKVIGAMWNETTAQWEVEVEDMATGTVVKTSGHILINAGGILNAWRFPPIPGIGSFKGDLVHSAAWKQDLSLKGKVVGLIGNGYVE